MEVSDWNLSVRAKYRDCTVLQVTTDKESDDVFSWQYTFIITNTKQSLFYLISLNPECWNWTITNTKQSLFYLMSLYPECWNWTTYKFTRPLVYSFWKIFLPGARCCQLGPAIVTQIWQTGASHCQPWPLAIQTEEITINTFTLRDWALMALLLRCLISQLSLTNSK